MEELWAFLLLFLVSLFWGVTNPWMKKASVGIEKVKGTNHLTQFLWEIKFLAGQPGYVVAFVINQIGGLLFLYCLSLTELSLVVPLTNSLAFLITTVTGQVLDEEPLNRRMWVGSACIVAGISLCVYDKTLRSNE